MLKYFRGKYDLIKDISRLVPLYFTVSKEQTQGQDTHQFKQLIRSTPNISNLGFLTKDKWAELLQQSTFILGFGDPILGPTLIDGLNAGCVFMNPRYDRPKHLIMTPTAPAHTQHDFGVTLGQPYVYTSDMKRKQDVVKIVQKILRRSESKEMQRSVRPNIYSAEQYKARLRLLLSHPTCDSKTAHSMLRKLRTKSLPTTSSIHTLIAFAFGMPAPAICSFLKATRLVTDAYIYLMIDLTAARDAALQGLIEAEEIGMVHLVNSKQMWAQAHHYLLQHTPLKVIIADARHTTFNENPFDVVDAAVPGLYLLKEVAGGTHSGGLLVTLISVPVVADYT
jgi:hypothetical protein